jgi:heme/copper-type cytochrome/quinol oxidase subunit 2
MISGISGARRAGLNFPTSSEYQPVHQVEAGTQPTSKEAASNQHAVHRKSTKSIVGTVILGLICFVQWCMTFAVVTYHFRKPTSPSSRSQEYLLNATVQADPHTIGQIPTQCVNWLKSADLVRMGLFSQYGDQIFSATLTVILFIITTVAGLWMIFIMAMQRANGPVQTTSRVLKICKYTVVLALVIGVVVTVLYAGITVGSKKHYVSFRYTNNPGVTGGCSFAFVSMDKEWGYWDVQDELAFRIAMSVFGAS